MSAAWPFFPNSPASSLKPNEEPNHTEARSNRLKRLRQLALVEIFHVSAIPETSNCRICALARMRADHKSRKWVVLPQPLASVADGGKKKGGRKRGQAALILEPLIVETPPQKEIMRPRALPRTVISLVEKPKRLSGGRQ